MFGKRDPIDLKAEAEQAVLQKEMEERAAQQEAEDFVEIMSTEYGRRFIWGQIARGGLFVTGYDFVTDGSAVFADGVKNEARYLMGMIMDHCPEKFVLMINEKEIHARRIAEYQRAS